MVVWRICRFDPCLRVGVETDGSDAVATEAELQASLHLGICLRIAGRVDLAVVTDHPVGRCRVAVGRRTSLCHGERGLIVLQILVAHVVEVGWQLLHLEDFGPQPAVGFRRLDRYPGKTVIPKVVDVSVDVFRCGHRDLDGQFGRYLIGRLGDRCARIDQPCGPDIESCVREFDVGIVGEERLDRERGVDVRDIGLTLKSLISK